MSATAAAVKAALLALTDENTRKKLGWVLAAVLAPVLLLAALLCALASGGAEHNRSVVELCFHGGALPADAPEEYQAYLREMQAALSQMNRLITQAEETMEGEEGFDAIRVKAAFFALYFGTEAPEVRADQAFLDCFLTYEERTRTVIIVNEDGEEVEQEETYTVALPISDPEAVWSNVGALTGVAVPEKQRTNADSIYHLVRYGISNGPEDWIPGAGASFFGTDGFCSPVGEGWEHRVTSEFGYRRDPFTGETRGHTGMDLAVPAGTPIRAALSGTVNVSRYDSGYGYYVLVDHGGGLATLYAHNSRLLVQAGAWVEAGDIIALSGSTGRSTGPHLHFEVRFRGGRTDPRDYLPET